MNWLASLAWIKPPGYTLEVPSDFNAGEFKLDLPDPLPDGEHEFEPLDLPGFQSLELPDFTAFLEDCGPGPNGVTRGRVSGFTAYQATRGREAANLSQRRQGGRQGRAQRRKITRPEI